MLGSLSSAIAQDAKAPDRDAIVASPDSSGAERRTIQRRRTALKPGGFLVGAGFKRASEADFLRHPEDPPDAAVFHPQIPTDEFALKYQKPL
jgi:predicted methyltransferase